MKILNIPVAKLFKPIDAVTIYPFIIARSKQYVYQYDALIEHELVHLRRQEEVGVVKWWFKYLTNSLFRYTEEILGYRRQIELGGISAHGAATLITTQYWLNVQFDTTLELLTN